MKTIKDFVKRNPKTLAALVAAVAAAGAIYGLPEETTTEILQGILSSLTTEVPAAP